MANCHLVKNKTILKTKIMKNLKALLIVMLALFTFGSAMAQDSHRQGDNQSGQRHSRRHHQRHHRHYSDQQRSDQH